MRQQRRSRVSRWDCCKNSLEGLCVRLASTDSMVNARLQVIDRCQNHVLPGSKVRRSYMHNDYADEKRAAWVALGAKLSTIIFV